MSGTVSMSSGKTSSSISGMKNMIHSDGDMAGMGAMNGSMNMMMNMSPMKMYFHFGTDEIILFKGWTTSNGGELFGSMLAVALMAFLFETIRVLRLKLLSTSARKLTVLLGKQSPLYENEQDGTSASGNKLAWSRSSDGSSNSSANGNQFIRRRITLADRLVHTCLKMVQFGLGYTLMLVVMTYNAWLYFAVIIGFGVGFAVYYKLTKVYTIKARRSTAKTDNSRQASAVEPKETPPPSDDFLY